MISMDIRHPDILHFIWSKSRPQDVFGKDALTGKIPDVFGANISVAITDDFMEAVKKDEFWDFKYPDRDADPEKYDREWDGDFNQWTGEWKLYHSLHARSVLYQIAAAAWTSGDPGVIYMDTVKRLTPGSYLHSSLVPHGSNPCFPADTLLLDGDKLRRIDSPNPETWTSWKTGVKEVWEFDTSIGLKFRCTPDHKIMLRDGSFVEAKDSIGEVLYPLGDFINPTPTAKDEEAVLAGFLFGDGYLSGGRQGVSVKLSPDREPEVYEMLRDWGFSQSDNITFYLNKQFLPQKVVSILGKPCLDKEIPFDIITSDSSNVTSFLRGLFEANGSCNVNGQISYKTISHKMATQIQLLLRSLGIDATISANIEKKIEWDNGNYTSKPSYNIQIPPRCGWKFKELIGFISERKTKNIKTYNKTTKSVTKVTGYSVIGEEEVWDYRMKEGNPWNFCGGIVAHNCGEQMLPPYGNCLLGALVLCNYVINPWSDEAEFDKATFLSEVDKSVEFLNEMSDINEGLHPLPEQRVMDTDSKRIGLEFTGLADCLAMLGMKYGDEQSIAFISDLLRLKAIQEIKTSNRIAKEKGCCYYLQTPEERNNFLDSPYIKELGLSDEIQDQIMLHGLRNTAFNTVGPTGSLSIVAGNCSSGVEPIYAMGYKRTTRLSDEPFTFIHKPALEWAKEEFLKTGFTYSVEELKKKLNYVESYELRWSDRIRVQSTVQRYTDSSISSTINLPEDCTPEDIFAIYEMGWAYQLKGITVFRDGCKKGVLETTEKKPERKEGTLYIRSLLDIERAERHRVFWKGAKLYITISLDENDHPLEVFVKLPREAGGNGEGYYREELYQEKTSLWDTITRLVTAQLRSGMPLEYIIKQLDKGSYTLTDAGAVLSRILKKYLYQLKEVEQEETGIGDECPECGEMSYIYTGGCPVCQKCGYSNCG